MTDEEKLRLDYEQTTKYFHELAEARFKLLALVPELLIWHDLGLAIIYSTALAG